MCMMEKEIYFQNGYCAAPKSQGQIYSAEASRDKCGCAKHAIWQVVCHEVRLQAAKEYELQRLFELRSCKKHFIEGAVNSLFCRIKHVPRRTLSEMKVCKRILLVAVLLFFNVDLLLVVQPKRRKNLYLKNLTTFCFIFIVVNGKVKTLIFVVIFQLLNIFV